MIYLATQRKTAFAEVLAHFRPSIRLRYELGRKTVDEDQSVDEALAETFDPDDVTRGLVTKDWRDVRQVAQTYLDTALRFVDITTAESFQELRVAAMDTIYRLGVADIDLSSVTSPQRKLTQECARYIYEQTDTNGNPAYAGIRYLSHLDARWECWAVYSDRFSHHHPFSGLTIHPDDKDLCEVSRLFDLSIETFNGHHVRP